MIYCMRCARDQLLPVELGPPHVQIYDDYVGGGV